MLNNKGRKGRDDYPGAEKLEVPHPKLHNGDSCPECLKGKIREAQSGVEYDWSGQNENAECERAIKQIIIHRKNSLFYRSIRGAQVGDTIQSLVATCQKMGVNSFEYLTWLQENKSAVKKSPNEFVPWCFSK